MRLDPGVRYPQASGQSAWPILGRAQNCRVPIRVSEVARFVDAAGEEVVKQTLLRLFELGNEPLRRSDRLIGRIQDLDDPPLFANWRQVDGIRKPAL